MAGKPTISITFKLDGDNKGFKDLANDAEGLKRVLTETISEAQKLNTSAINFASLATGISEVQGAVSQLQGVLKGFSDAYASQIEVETKLATVMKNTMGAREDEIRSIKDLCSAQQELGVIGDEVQLAGAQELATYLTKSDSLKALIPVMNDMLAQQYGLNASQENAASIATMLGKVMDGQVNALSRYGYKFDEAQERILKYGTEAQRVATLCEVVSQSVGGVNAELAATDAGKLKQVENTLGDIKEKLGSIVKGIMPFATISAECLNASASAAKLILSFKALRVVSISTLKSIKNFGVEISKTASLFGTELVGALKGGTHGIKLFVTAWRGLLVSTGIGIAIAAVTVALGYFISKANDAEKATNKLIDAEERAKRKAEELEQAREEESSALRNTQASLEIHIAKIKAFNGTKEEEKKLVKELNATYGSTMGYFNSLADWYKALIANSEAYCRQMVLEAKTRNLANRIAQTQQEAHDIAYNEQGNKRKYSTKREQKYQVTEGPAGAYMEMRDVAGTSDIEKAQKAYNDKIAEGVELEKQLTTAVKELGSLSFDVVGSKTNPDDIKASAKKEESQFYDDPQNIKEYTESLAWLDKEIFTATGDELKRLNILKAKYSEGKKALQELGVEAQKNEPIYREEAATLAEINENISYRKKELETASKEQAAIINADMERWEKEAQAIQQIGRSVEDNNPKFNANAKTLAEIEENISALNNDLLKTASVEEAAVLNTQIRLWREKADAIRKAGESTKATFDSFRQGWNGIQGIGSGVDSITKALEENGTAWEKVNGIVQGFISIYDGIKSVIAIINAITAVTETLTGAKTTEATAETAATAATTAGAAASVAAASEEVAASEAVTTAKVAEAGAKTLAAHASIPWVGIAIAGGMIATMTAMMFALPKFADGGIVTGPTLGLIGEYAGASNNPEVIAPLDKLRSLLEPQGLGGKVEFEIDGRKLKGVLRKVEQFDSRTR